MKLGDHLWVHGPSLLGKEGPQIGCGGMDVEVPSVETAEHVWLLPERATIKGVRFRRPDAAVPMPYGSSNSAHTGCVPRTGQVALFPSSLSVPPFALLLTPAIGPLTFLLALPVGLLAFLLAFSLVALVFLLALPLLAFRPLLI